MLIYAIIFIVIAWLAILYEIKPFNITVPFIFLFLFLAFFAGLRGQNVDPDHYGYLHSFNHTDEYDINLGNSSLPFFEPGFILIVKFFKSIFRVNYVIAIMLFFAFISVGFKMCSISKLSFNPFLSLLFYYAYFFLLHEMIQIRVGFASAIFFIAIPFYLRKKYLTYFLLIITAAFFHYSAILYLLLFLFDSKTFNRKFLLIFLLSTIIVGLLKLPFLNYVGLGGLSDVSEKLNTYKDLAQGGYEENINVYGPLFIINFLISLGLILFLPPQKVEENPAFVFLLKCNIFSTFLVALLSGIPLLSFRVSELFQISSIIILPYFIFLFPNRLLGTIIVITIAAALFYFNIYYAEWLGPYYFTPIK